MTQTSDMLDLIVLESVSSTNDFLKKNHERFNSCTAVIALEQTNGRGRLGRSWEAGVGSLYLSLLFKPEKIRQDFTLVCALAVSDALESAFGIKTGIKWPNDVLLNGKKLCGILVENITEGSMSYVIVGIGINLNNEYFPIKIKDKASSIFLETGIKCDIRETGRRVAEEIVKRYKMIDSVITHEYSSRCVTLGKNVRASKGEYEINGVAHSVNPDGSLLVVTDTGERISIYSGEVTLS